MECIHLFQRQLDLRLNEQVMKKITLYGRRESSGRFHTELVTADADGMLNVINTVMLCMRAVVEVLCNYYTADDYYYETADGYLYNVKED